MFFYFTPLLFLFAVLTTGCTSDSKPTQDDAAPSVQARGIPLLVIAVEYKNIRFTNDAATWHQKIFGTEPHQLNHYFYEISHGIYSVTPANETNATTDGIISVLLNKNHPDYLESELHLIHFDLKTAIEAADPSIDFRAYDTNRDQTITSDELQLLFVIAGYEDAYSLGFLSPGIWAHSDCIEPENTPLVDHVTLMGCDQDGSYSLIGERHENHDATIGVMAHELIHSNLHLPDLYDTTGEPSAGIGYFGLMGYGVWGRASEEDPWGNTPVHPCAWSKMQLGWTTPQIFSATNGAIAELNASDSAHYNIAKIPISGTEYFLLENRDNSGYDRGLYNLDASPGYTSVYGEFAGGLAIWHIDETVIDPYYSGSGYSVNGDETHKGVDLEEASDPVLDSYDPNYYDEYLLGHPNSLYFAENVNAFTPLSEPCTDGYVAGGTGIWIEDISSRGAVMHATITNPN